MGNPPFLGSKNKSFGKGQKESMAQAMPKAIDGVKLWSKSDYRYSADVVYNNFPWQTLTEEEKQSISESADAILQARAAFPDSTLEQLYKPELMPAILVDAHRKNDRIVAKVYGIDLNLTDEEIALILMRRSVEMSKPKPKRKKRKNKRSK